MKTGRKASLWIATGLIVTGATLCLGELVVRTFSPTEYLSPRYQFSKEYEIVPFPNTVMVHGVPGKYRYHYSVNAIKSRGEVVEPGASGLPAVVVLGDSYSFGIGVSDGDDYSSVMREKLRGRADVASLASPGWGLTQEIRRYYELGERYHPRIVVLQFCANDPEDNISNQVTRVEHGEFVFRDVQDTGNGIKRYLSRSPLQRTQLYNFFRSRVSMVANGRTSMKAKAEMRAMRADGSWGAAVPAGEALHIDLLSAFARHLRDEGTSLWVIAVDNQLKEFPHIEQAVHDLDARGEMRYFEVTDWLAPIGPHSSPEGHVWDAEAHRVIGEHLAAEVMDAFSNPSVATNADADVDNVTDQFPRITLTGELLDLYCFMEDPDGATGTGHAKCAKTCIQKSMPVGFLADDGTMYTVIATDHEPAGEMVADFIGAKSTVTGVAIRHHGVNAIAITSVTLAFNEKEKAK